MPAGAIRHLDHNSPHGHERHECGSSAGLDWTKTKEHDVTTTPNFEDLLAELREDLVNSLDDAMGKCPHEGVSSEWDLCNACAADTAVKVMRHLLNRTPVATPEVRAEVLTALGVVPVVTDASLPADTLMVVSPDGRIDGSAKVINIGLLPEVIDEPKATHQTCGHGNTAAS